ncbi:MAG: transglutaminase family protein [Bryobacterales bacterium]|nr:transglutaminase family protein [Bryobacterales bacterium]
MRELQSLLIHRDRPVPLDLAALQLAQVEFPDLDPAPFLSLLDSHARELQPLTANITGPRFVEIANRYFFETLEFQGNQQEYYHPHNSCLNQVLLNRTGLPIALSLVYMEIARRLQRPVVGIGLPGHFLICYRDQSYTAWIDCFRGREVSFEEIRELALETARVDILAIPSALAPVTPWQILVRMLNNLRNVYFQQRAWPKARWILDRLIEAQPAAPLERKQRGVLRLDAGDETGALDDFETYLMLAPRSDEDRDTIAAQAARLKRSGNRA